MAAQAPSMNALPVIISTIAALGFASLFGHGMLTPCHPYRVGYGAYQVALARRLTAECWIGVAGFIVSVMIAGAQVHALFGGW